MGSAEMGTGMTDTKKAVVKEGRTALGIEFGSTRIKAVLIDETHQPIAMGTHDWEIVWKMESGPILWRISGTGCRTVTEVWQQM